MGREYKCINISNTDTPFECILIYIKNIIFFPYFYPLFLSMWDQHADAIKGWELLHEEQTWRRKKFANFFSPFPLLTMYRVALRHRRTLSGSRVERGKKKIIFFFIFPIKIWFIRNIDRSRLQISDRSAIVFLKSPFKSTPLILSQWAANIQCNKIMSHDSYL